MGYKTRIINVQNVAANQKAIINLPLGPTYDKLMLDLSGNSAYTAINGQVTNIEIKANGRRIFVDTAANIHYRNAFRGLYVDALRLMIDFTEPMARGGANEQLLASIPSAMLKSLTVEVQFGNNGAPSMNVFAESRGPSENPFILKRLDFTQSFAQSGLQTLLLPSGASGGIIKRAYLHPNTNASTTITAVDLRVNRVSIWDTTKDMIEYNQRVNKLTPQSMFLALDFVEDGNLAQALNTERAKEIELRLNLNAACSITGYVDYIDPVGRL